MTAAIVGMACLFPGAPDLETYWKNLRTGFDAITEVPKTRLDPVFFDEAARGQERFYCRRGGFVDAYAAFDAAAFGVMPLAARGAEPDQLLALEVAAKAIADAGYDARPFAREKAAVILGRGGYAGAGRTRLEQHVRGAEQVVATLRALLPDLDDATLARVKRELQADLGAPNEGAAIGLVPNLAASRIAHRLDLHGPAFTVDAACASALVAVDQGVRELESGRCDLVVCGGVHLCQDEAFWSVFCQLGALSHSEAIRPFDRRADGLLIGEGIGIVVLRRLADALKDDDRIYAVVRGVGSSSDGRGAALMSPAASGQVLALERAWREAKLDPASVGLVEAHGTGTPAGDAAELTTLAKVFGRAEAGAARAVLGSVKSMIGHAMPAAGAAGLIKAALAVHHGVLLPTLHCDEPHPLLDTTRFRTISREEPWDAAVRRAAVNAFGFGGINAHVVLEGHAPRAAKPLRPRPAPSVEAQRAAVFSAATPEELLQDLAAGRERKDGGAARAVVFDPTPERMAKARTIVERAKPWRGRDGVWFSPRGLLKDGGTLAFLFPGVDASFEPHVDDVARAFALPLPACTEATNLEEVGIGIVGVNRLLDRVLRGLGVVPADVAGHSIGEWSGMIATGIIPEPALDAFMKTLKPGTLEVPGVVFAAAGCGSERARAALAGLPEIEVSHDNCPHQVILCGKDTSMDVALARLKEGGILCQKLPFQSGFHSGLFAGYVAPHEENFARLPLEAPRAPLWSATTCAPYPRDPKAIRALAIEHLVKPVRFRELVEALYAKGARAFVQVGTGSLVNFVEDTLRGRPHLAISANVKDRSGMDQLRRLVAALFVEGADVDVAKVAARAPSAMPLALGVPLVRSFTPLERAAARPVPPPVKSALATEFAASLAAVESAQRDVMALLAKPRAARPEPRETVTTRTLSVETMPELLDHSFFRQPKGWPVLSDRHPVVPMTTSIDLMMEHAEATVPGKVAVQVLDVRAYRWLVVSTPVEAKITCRYDGIDKVHVKIGDYSEATVVLADRYPDAPPDDTRPLVAEAKATIDAKTLYEDRWMFHGPDYQGVVDVGDLGEDGIRGALECGPARGMLLDNAGQLFGYWVMMAHETNRMAMPVRLSKLSFYGPHPRPGERLTCTVRITSRDDKAVTADLVLGKNGRAWCVIDRWEDRRFETDARLWPVMLFPEKNLLAEPRPEGFVVFEDKYRGAPTRDQLARRFLGEAERADYEKQGPKKQRAWLSARICAKDAVRDLLFRKGRGPMFPVEIALEGDPPVVKNAGRDVRVAVAQEGDVTVAVAREGHACKVALGKDLEVLVVTLGRGAVKDRTGDRFLIGDTWIKTAKCGDLWVAWTET